MKEPDDPNESMNRPCDAIGADDQDTKMQTVTPSVAAGVAKQEDEHRKGKEVGRLIKTEVPDPVPVPQPTPEPVEEVVLPEEGQARTGRNTPRVKTYLQPEGSKLLLLISSMSGSLDVKSRQRRMQSILEGLQLPSDQVEIMDGCDPAMKQRRLQLFVLSGKRAQYPQLFLVNPPEQIQYLGNSEDIFFLHETDTLGDAIGLVVEHIRDPAPQSAAASSLPTCSWARTKSTRNLVVKKEAFEIQGNGEEPLKEDASKEEEPKKEEDTKKDDDGCKEPPKEYTEEEQLAASKIQLAVRVCLFPILQLQKELQKIQKDKTKKVEKVKKESVKEIYRLRRRFDKHQKEIKRQLKKEKQLKKDIKDAKKKRDSLRKKNKKERSKAKKLDKYLRRLNKGRKQLDIWDRDTAAIRAENERLLAYITKISEEISNRNVNWTELMKDESNKQNEEEGKIPDEKEGQAAKASEATVTDATETTAPRPVPRRRGSTLKDMLKRQDTRRNMVAMVRQESQRFAGTSKKDEEEAAPVFFVRLNSHARLLG